MPREPDRRQFHRIQLGIRELRRQWWVHFVLLKNIENQSQKKNWEALSRAYCLNYEHWHVVAFELNFRQNPPGLVAGE
jgi:peptidyl-tRNA hydrolase